MMIGGVVVGILLLIVSVVYFTHAANVLPHFFPGYDATMTAKHTKHGIAALILAVLAFIYAWFQAGPKKAASAE